jgi:hypothetical protein
MITVTYYININCTYSLSIPVNTNIQQNEKTKDEGTEHCWRLLNIFNTINFISQEQNHSQTFAPLKAFYHLNTEKITYNMVAKIDSLKSF